MKAFQLCRNRDSRSLRLAAVIGAKRSEQQVAFELLSLSFPSFPSSPATASLIHINCPIFFPFLLSVTFIFTVLYFFVCFVLFVSV